MTSSDHLRVHVRLHASLRRVGLLVFLLCGVVGSTAFRAVQGGPPPRPVSGTLAPTDSLPADPSLATGTLPNGMRYYVRANGTPQKRAELRLVVNAGSVLEDADQRGLAHFLEHMAFNGTTHFKQHELINYLQSVGMKFGADLNAYTSYDETVYMLTIPSDSAPVLEQGVQILEDWAHGITIDSAEVIAERGVVLEEWRLRGFSDRRANKLRFEMDSVYYNGAAYAERTPVGQRERITGARREEIARFYHDWYRPDLMAIVVVGDFDRDRMVAMIRERFGRIAGPATPRPRPRIAIADNEQTGVRVIPVNGSGTSIRVTLKGPPRANSTVAGYRQALVDRLYTNMLNHRLYEAARQPNPSFLTASIAVGSMAEGRVPYYDVSFTGRRFAVRTGLAAVLTEVERVAQHGFTPAEIDRERRSLLREMESDSASGATIESATYAKEYVANYLTPGWQLASPAQSLALVRQLLPKITPAEIAAPALRWRTAKNRLITGQIPGLARQVTADVLLAVCDSVARTTLAPYTGKVDVRPLLTKEPAPGRITSERTIAAVGVTEWTLSNGARVLLKPTKYGADEVTIRGHSQGGLSLADDSIYVSALSASSLVRQGGLGDLTAGQLGEALRDKVVRGFSATIGDNEEDITVDGSPRDLETLFRLAYLQIAAPRVDSASFEVWKAAARPAFANAGGGLGEFLRRYMSLQHPRTRPTRYDMVDSVDMDAALAFYRQRFQNAGDFTFVIVGDFTPARVRPLVERYIASLPTTGKRETARDLDIRTPTGVLEETYNISSEAKSLTYVNFPGTFEFSRQNKYQLTMLAQVLQLRLTDRLREELGGTYGVSVNAMAEKTPYEHYELSMQFSSAPERTKELGDALFQVFDSLKAHGPTPSELQEVKAMARRALERDSRSNGFWLNGLVQFDALGWPLAELTSLDALNRAVTVESVQQAARQFLDEKNHVHLTFQPRTDIDFDYMEGGR